MVPLHYLYESLETVEIQCVRLIEFRQIPIEETAVDDAC